ncbi:hypothetical protein K491DRAFT_730774 [Lophiostoma macrostomum CBS 122681]|uniref:Protein kinase domain-containing protein n=1 Tax=Lophiostoma macrostomum CBS 122681 TaxID=1314788 RepID=A0A6A6SST7_9PLEO|nr:hypothetical protein K491DRAFT_730774 [Lophiostoma macrostomum CBS 122681]
MLQSNAKSETATDDDRLHLYEKTNRQYIPVLKAGSGRYGNVWLALKADVLHSKKPFKPQLIALKLPTPRNENMLTREVQKLQYLQTTAGSPTARFVTCFHAQWDESHTYCDWYTMTAIPGFTLHDLIVTFACPSLPVPEALVSHVAIQLAEAFRWLHTHDPPLLHGDFHEANVMLDPSKQDVPGFPNVTLIVFGNAKDGTPAALHVERVRYFQMIKELAMVDVGHTWCVNTLREKHADCNHDDEWIEFLKVVRDPRCIQNGQYAMGWQEFWGRCLFKAIKRRDNASQKVKMAVRRRVDLAMQKSAVMGEVDCMEAVEYFKTIAPSTDVSDGSPGSSGGRTH